MSIFQRTVWYAQGLAFECGRCGRCCAGPPEGYVWVDDDEIRALAAFLRLDEAKVRSDFTRPVGMRLSLAEDVCTRNCVFLAPVADGGAGCAVYPVRPAQCRTWPFWPGNLADPDAWSRAADRCPGVNRGPLHDQEEIQRKRDQTHS